MGKKALLDEIENTTAYLADLHQQAGIEVRVTPNGSLVIADDLVFAAVPGNGLDVADYPGPDWSN